MCFVQRWKGGVFSGLTKEPRTAHTGKTTLLRRLFRDSHQYVSLELPDVRVSAESDPRGFLAAHSAPVIFDEVQYAPDLLPYIKERIDEKRGVMP